MSTPHEVTAEEFNMINYDAIQRLRRELKDIKEDIIELKRDSVNGLARRNGLSMKVDKLELMFLEAKRGFVANREGKYTVICNTCGSKVDVQECDLFHTEYLRCFCKECASRGDCA